VGKTTRGVFMFPWIARGRDTSGGLVGSEKWYLTMLARGGGGGGGGQMGVVGGGVKGQLAESEGRDQGKGECGIGKGRQG